MKLLINESKLKYNLSEGLNYHLNNNLTIQDSVYRMGSDAWCELINEVRKLSNKGVLYLNEDEQFIVDSDAGKYGLYEGETVPLDAPFPLDDNGNYAVFCLNEEGITEKVVFSESDSNSITVYHGSNHLIKNFSTEFVGAEEAKDMEGPGIYFTTKREDAEQYGEYLYVLELTPKGKFISDTVSEKKANITILKKLITSKEDWESLAQNWSENENIGLKMAIKSFIDYSENEKDVYLSVWYDFFRYNPKEYVDSMANLGFDGVIMNNPYRNDYNGEFKHFIIYNPNIITIKEVYKNGEKIY